MLAGWPPQWCDPCVLTQFPPTVWALSQLLERCLQSSAVRISGASSLGGSVFQSDVVRELSPERFDFFIRRLGLNEDDGDDLYAVLEIMHAVVQEWSGKDVPFGEPELAALRKLRTADDDGGTPNDAND